MATKPGNPANYLRLTGQAVFFPSGAVAGILLGNIFMHKLTASLDTKEHYASRGGRKVLDRTDVIQTKGEYELELDEAFTANLPILLFSAPPTIVTQAAVAAPTGTAALAAITLDTTYDLGKRKLVTVVVKKGTTTLIGVGDNRDYTLDADLGIITFHSGVTTLIAGDAIAVTFGCAALSRESFIPFSQPQRAGTLRIWETDDLPEAGVGFRVEKTIPCQLRVDGTQEYKSDDYTKWTVKCAVTGPMTELREPRALAGF